ncbi:MAG: PKD domain-containing protein [Candidatus Absconditabacterales bacterium]
MGDVCDEDIDGDGLLNPINLVNDIGFINPKYYLQGASSPVLALAIENDGPVYRSIATTFVALYSGIVTSLDRDFGDGQDGQGISAKHIYASTGIKQVYVVANNQLSASMVVNVLDATKPQILKTLSIQADKLVADKDEIITFEAITTGGVQSVRRQFGDNKTATGNKVKHSFATPGTYTVYAIGDEELTARVVVNIAHNPKQQQDSRLDIDCQGDQDNNSQSVTCKASSSQDIQNITWTLCDGQTGVGKQIVRRLSQINTSCLVTAIGDKKFMDQAVVDYTLPPQYDNCPTSYNSKQDDVNNNGLGDECEKPISGGNALLIKTTADKLTAPTKVMFEPISSGYTCITGNNRNFGNGQSANANKGAATYNKGGTYEIGLVDCKNNTAFTTITVADTGDTQVGLQLVANPLSGPDGFTTKVTPKIQGVCDTISRTIDNQTQASQTTNKNQTANLTIKGPSQHPVTAYCYTNNQVKAVAQVNVGVNSNTGVKPVSSYLEADTLTPVVGQAVKLKTITQGFDAKQIQNVSREFGDGTSFSSKSLNTTHVYLKPGIAVVDQVITLINGQTMNNIIQLNIQEGDTGDGFSANLVIKPMIGTTSESFLLQLIPNNTEKIASLVRYFGDGQIKQSPPNELKILHTYAKAGTYNVGVLVTLNNDEQPSYGGQITVNGVDKCLGLLKTSGQKPFKCDMDKDSTPDMCDDDIDGDGYSNPVGILNRENDDCSIGNNLNTPLLEQYSSHSNNDPSIDNCPIKSNPDQLNTDKDQYGNICDPQPNTPNTNSNNDNDNDGTPNHLDNLPSVPNGPFSIKIVPGNSASVPDSNISSTCTTCPCGFTQTLSPIAQGDIVYAEMEYQGGVIQSNFFPVK